MVKSNINMVFKDVRGLLLAEPGIARRCMGYACSRASPNELHWIIEPHGIGLRFCLYARECPICTMSFATVKMLRRHVPRCTRRRYGFDIYVVPGEMGPPTPHHF
jgi:hypothetical protein